MPPEVQEQHTQQQITQPVTQPAAELDMSDEAIMGRALATDAANTPPRDPTTGRFLPQQQAQAQANAETEKPAEQTEEAQPAETATDESEEAVKWDEVKDVKIKVPMKDGEKVWEEEVTLEQLRAERMMQSDYTKKTQEIAQRERQAQEATQQAVDKERTQYLEALGALRKSVQQAAMPEFGNVDWNKLAAENPGEYVRLSNRAREFNEAMQRVAFEEEKVQAQQSKERQSRLDQAVAESRVKLKEEIPTWNDDLYQSLLKRGVDTYGFKPDEMSQVWDHRIMRVLHDAHQWQAMQQGKPLAEKKVVTVPNVLRPGNAKPKVDPKTQELTKTRERLAANGNDMDAAAALMGNFLK
jgi:hypothetical protein